MWSSIAVKHARRSGPPCPRSEHCQLLDGGGKTLSARGEEDMNHRGEEFDSDRPGFGGGDGVPLDDLIDLDAANHDEHVAGILREVRALGLARMSQRIDVEARYQATLADERVRRLLRSDPDRPEGKTGP